MPTRCTQLYRQITAVLQGQLLFGHESLVRSLTIAFLARGHVLIEGPPGTGKTMSAKLLARLLAHSSRRIQFTSDMLPSDLIGAHLYNPAERRFDFIPGPIFADFIVADEVNRTPARTQSALLEAMEERQVTVEGHTMPLSEDFFVVATQNPHDFEGTYPLPESQLDRFLFKLTLSHASADHEASILARVLDGSLPPVFEKLSPLAVDRAGVHAEIAAITVNTAVLRYIATLLERTRSHPLLSYGSGVRGGIALARAARVAAAIDGRDFVTPDDVKRLALDTLRHRVRLSSDALLSQETEQTVISRIVADVPFPQ